MANSYPNFGALNSFSAYRTLTTTKQLVSTLLWELRGTAEVRKEAAWEMYNIFSACLTEVVWRCLQLGLRLFTLHGLSPSHSLHGRGWKGRVKKGKGRGVPFRAFLPLSPSLFCACHAATLSSFSLPLYAPLRFSSPSFPFLRLHEGYLLDIVQPNMFRWQWKTTVTSDR